MQGNVVSFIEPQKGYRKTTRVICPMTVHDEILPLSVIIDFHVTTGRNQTIAKRVGLIMSSLTHVQFSDRCGLPGWAPGGVVAYACCLSTTTRATCWPYLSFTYQQQARLQIFCVLLRTPGSRGMLSQSVGSEQHNPCKPRGIYVGRTFRPYSVALLHHGVLTGIAC